MLCSLKLKFLCVHKNSWLIVLEHFNWSWMGNTNSVQNSLTPLTLCLLPPICPIDWLPPTPSLGQPGLVDLYGRQLESRSPFPSGGCIWSTGHSLRGWSHVPFIWHPGLLLKHPCGPVLHPCDTSVTRRHGADRGTYRHICWPTPSAFPQPPWDGLLWLPQCG